MSEIDVSVVLNMHREAPYLRATLLSLDACANSAREAGLICELVAVFDRADEATSQVFKTTRIDGFETIVIVEVNVGSLGMARNAGIDAAHGEFIWIADGDDLVSRNCIVELHRTASSNSEENCVVFVNYCIGFGETNFVGKYFDGSFLTIADLAFQHCYISRIFIRRSAFDNLRYSDLRISSGFAYEDWEFNARLWHLGYQFVIAPKSIFFYRQRVGSLVKRADSVSVRMIPHIQAFDPAWFIRKLEHERKQIGNWRQFVQKRQQLFQQNYASEIINSSELRGYVLEACDLDPEIDPLKIDTAGSYTPIPRHGDHWGYRLAEAYKLAGTSDFTDVVLLPWLNPGGAEKYILQVLDEISTANPAANFLVLCGEPSRAHTWARKIPYRSTMIDIFNAFPTLTVEDRDRMTARLLLATTRPGARLHIKTSTFAHRLLNSYANVMLHHFRGIYYRFCDDSSVWKGHRTDSSFNEKFLRAHLPMLHRIICDCRYISDKDTRRIGLNQDRYFVVPSITSAERTTIPSAEPSYRLLWASRITSQKRPELVSAIVQRLREVFPALKIDVFGHLEIKDAKLLFDMPGLTYCGPFDGFQSLPIEKYDAMIYTSYFDGLPNIILESMASGLPVIAPDVGGISEVVILGKTGFLVPDDPDDGKLIRAYVETTRSMYENWGAIQSISLAGQALIAEQCGSETFSKNVAAAFGNESVLPFKGNQQPKLAKQIEPDLPGNQEEIQQLPSQTMQFNFASSAVEASSPAPPRQFDGDIRQLHEQMSARDTQITELGAIAHEFRQRAEAAEAPIDGPSPIKKLLVWIWEGLPTQVQKAIEPLADFIDRKVK